MNDCFADTSYFVALLSPADRFHAKALEIAKGFRGRMITSAWVLAELGNSLSSHANRPRFTALVSMLKASPSVLIIPPDSNYFEAALQLYARRSDKTWSFVDCISFLAMEKHRISIALTADHHFEQAGFQTALK